MLGKARLVKKQTLDKIRKPAPPKTALTETNQRVRLTPQIVQTTKDWLVNHREQKTNARQAFAALFINSDAPSNAV